MSALPQTSGATPIEETDEVASQDFLDFQFGPRGYSDQLATAVQKTGALAAVTCSVRAIKDNCRVVWISHDFGFLGGSLGCAEGERIARAFEHATNLSLPVVVSCVTGGARMQEGVLSLMQMAKVSVCVEAHRRAGLPFITALKDPTYGASPASPLAFSPRPYPLLPPWRRARCAPMLILGLCSCARGAGGVSASYAMQADVRIGIAKARIGFAGPDVILNTMFEQDQRAYDEACPERFQSAEFVQERGGLDIVLDDVAQVTRVPTEVAPPRTRNPHLAPRSSERLPHTTLPRPYPP
jgi:acetyl-CoA carboxylase beta subunit